jgi:signal transduction histidine kinase
MKNLLEHIRRSLWLKLCVCIVLLATPIFLAALSELFLQSRAVIKSEAQQRAATVLSTTMHRVARQLKTIETATESMAWIVTDDWRPERLLYYSRNIAFMNANVDGCSITAEPYEFPSEGRYFSAYTVRRGDSLVTQREAPYDYFVKPWYAIPRQEGTAIWIDPYDDTNEGTLSALEKITSYCKPLYDSNHRLLGVIATDMSLRRLAEIVNEEKLYPNSYFFLLGRNGNYIVHPDSSLLINPTSIGSEDSQPPSRDIIALGYEMMTAHMGVAEVDYRGQHCFISYMPVAGTPWSLALVCPERDVLGSYYRLTYLVLPLLLLGMVGIIVLCRAIVAHAIRPIGRLLRQSRQIAEGNFTERIPHTSRQDAVGRVQNSFATMQESLESHLHGISQMNNELEHRNKELAEASRLAEEAERQKTLFIQNMTHQIRTPLNIIMGFAQVLRDNGKDMATDDVRSLTDLMQHNVRTLQRMVLMLYDSSDIGADVELRSQHGEVVAVNQLARDCIEHTYLHFPKLHINFETLLSDTLTIHSNYIYLMRSIRELLYNAAKYSDGEHVVLRLSQTADSIVFVFEDTGAGIPEEYRDRIFAPFIKVNDLSQGLGLGLSLSKRHFQNLGGDLTLDTSYTVGCRLIAEVPKC